jgi:hypothetical protein
MPRHWSAHLRALHFQPGQVANIGSESRSAWYAPWHCCLFQTAADVSDDLICQPTGDPPRRPERPCHQELVSGRGPRLPEHALVLAVDEKSQTQSTASLKISASWTGSEACDCTITH